MKLASWSRFLLQGRVSKLLLPTADKINQTGATCLEILVQWNHNIIFWLTFAMIHSVEITFLLTSFKRFRLERDQIRQISLDLEQLTSLSCAKRLWYIKHSFPTPPVVVMTKGVNVPCSMSRTLPVVGPSCSNAGYIFFRVSNHQIVGEEN